MPFKSRYYCIFPGRLVLGYTFKIKINIKIKSKDILEQARPNQYYLQTILDSFKLNSFDLREGGWLEDG